jgi:6,7-dimethyl-8-ribityllumazine synthase
MYRIALIISEFNQEITALLKKSALNQFEQKNNPIKIQDIFTVPGAIEIPVVAACLAKKNIYEAIVCFGAVIRGDTDHYDYVCWQVSYGCQKVSIENNIPVIFGVLTTDNEEQAFKRINKGEECADAALHMISVINSIRACHLPLEN